MSLNGGGNLGLGITLSADPSSAVSGFHELDKAISGTSKSVDAAKKALGQMAVGGALFGVGAEGMHGFAGLAASAGEFESVLMRVGLISRASTASMELLRRASIEAGMATQFSPKEAAEGLKILASQGLNARDSIAALLPALNLATGGGIGVEASTIAMSAALKVFGLNVDQAGAVADKLLHIGHITHFQANELEIFMGTIGRGAGITKAGLDEMLIAGGLVRNTGVDMSVAASSVSAALVHMGQNASHFKKLGVNITDAKGAFRPFLDVIAEASDAIGKRFPNAAKQVETAEKLFARFGLTAYSAIGGQLAHGVHDAEGNIYKGTAAIQYLRREMEKAGGTGQKFTDAVNASFKGSVKQWHGSVETMGILAGDGFQRMFTPVIQTATGALNRLIGFVNDMSPSTKKLLSQVLLGAAGFVGLVGAVIMGVAAFKLLAAGAAFAHLTFSGLLLTVLPVVAAVAALALVIGGAKLSGSFDGLGKKAALAFDAISMLFSRGGFTKKMWDELNEGGNQGVMKFALHVYHWGSLIMEFARGVWKGFQDAIDIARPTFEALGDAFWNVGKALGLVGEETSGEAVGRWDRWATNGEKLGAALGKMAEIVAGGLKTALELAAPVIKVFQGWWATLKDEVVQTGKSLEDISKRLEDAAGSQTKYGKAADDSADSSRRFWGALKGTGDMLLRFGGGILRGVLDLLEGVGGAFNNLAAMFTTSVGHIEGTWNKVFLSMKVIAFNFFSFVMNIFFGVALLFARIIDAIGKLKGEDWGLAKGLQEAKAGALGWAQGSMGIAWQGGKYYHAGAVPQAPPAYVPWSEAPPEEGGMSLPGPAPAPTYSPGANASSEETNAALARIEKAITAGQVTNVSVGGEALLRITKGEGRSEAISSWDPGVSMAPAD